MSRLKPAAVAFVAVGAVGAGAMSGSAAPLRVAAAASERSWLPVVVSVGGVTAMLDVILSQLLGLSRMAIGLLGRLVARRG